jgi:hypothetical protein
MGTAGLEVEPIRGRERSGSPLAKSQHREGASECKMSGVWWALQDSNLRPRACEARALTN